MPPSLTTPVITDELVTLRPFEVRDVDAVLDASTDPLIPLVTSVPDTPDRELAAAFVTRQQGRAAAGVGYSFAIEADSVCVGQIGFWLQDVHQGRVTIGYWIRPSSRRRGHAAHALGALTSWAWTMPTVHRLQLFIDPDNTGSRRTAERAGYEREGLLRRWEVIADKRRDMLIYARARPQ